VIGCKAEMPIEGEDYCIEPPADVNHLVLTAFRENKDDLTTPKLSLGICEGDCDTDNDCAVS